VALRADKGRRFDGAERGELGLYGCDALDDSRPEPLPFHDLEAVLTNLVEWPPGHVFSFTPYRYELEQSLSPSKWA
jgi:hypothetical protein